jgi:hypothetical protein
MVQNILVVVIVAAALVFVVRRFYRSFKRTDAGGCSCGSGCSCDDAYRCHSFDKYFIEEACREGSRRSDP